MRMDTSQQMRLGQQMKLAPRMIQSMEILQLPLPALQERIEQELESNIALELIEPGSEEDMPDETEDDAPLDQTELVVGDDHDFERLNEFASSYRDAFDGDQAPIKPRPTGERDGKLDAMANTEARGESLAEQLARQWSFFDLEQNLARAGEIIIDYLDDDGLLSTDLETILEQHRNRPGLELTEELLEEALEEIQQHLEPPGVGARNQREMLLLQVDARERDLEDEHDWSDVRTLIKDHFDDLLQNRLPRIEQSGAMSMARIRAAMELMKQLSLSPGKDLVDEDLRPIIPDIVVEFDEAGDEYIAALSDGAVPPLRISAQYERMAKDRTADGEAREFAGESVRRATWLIESINQRSNTLLRVARVVLARQREFFDYGPQHLKPLPMVDVAEQLGIHVGTVSRAVAEKWMQTPRGLYPLRRFFSGGATTESGREMSWEAVRETLREIIDNEDKADPMSDEALAAALKTRGIDIARRTVVKYRKQLDIPTARLRKVH